MTKRNEAKPEKCPDPVKGSFCHVCCGTYICLEPWRKKRTYKQRIEARREARRT